MPDPAGQDGGCARQFKRFALAAAAVTLGGAGLLGPFFRFALGDEFYSYIPLIPLVCVYVAWTRPAEAPGPSRPAGWAAAGFLAAGLAAAAGCGRLKLTPGGTAVENVFAAGMLAWVLFVTAAGCLFLGRSAMRRLAFPFCLLLFMVPFPTGMRAAIEAGLQQGSAFAADWLFTLSGTAYLRQGLEFHLPTITLQVAPECSGIHSTWILLITSLVAGQLLLRRPGSRAVLCLAVLPLALLRNGFRVFVIGQLCVHVGPRMIDSPIHHHGGPLFFGLSLGPFFLLLWYLRRRENPRPPSAIIGPPQAA